MNSLKGLGVFVLLAGIAVAVSLAGRVQQIVFAVTAGLVVMSTVTYAASRKRYRSDRLIAGGPDMTQILPMRRISGGASTNRSRPTTRRRRRIALAPVPVVALILGAGALYAAWHIAPSKPAADAAPTAPLTVRYRTDTPSTALVGKPWLEVINTSAVPVRLSDVKLRYYFNADQDSAYGANCYQTALRCSSITETIGALASSAPGASHYLQVGFTASAGVLAAGRTSQGIGLQLFRLDHKELNQTDDHSFNPKATHYTPSRVVTAYIDGQLSWGEEPARQGQAALNGPSTTPAPVTEAPRPGVVFDNFHYTGPDDPALAVNRWRVRTEGGGPGIHDTWSSDAVSFPADTSAQGGQALQLTVSTDGTKPGTKQAELLTTSDIFFTGTLAARIFFADRPASGRGGDHINEVFYTISPSSSSPNYSELDWEYQPNGGWGIAGPKLDTTSWRSSKDGDRVTHALIEHLAGWHIMMLTAIDGVVTYSVDGRKVFSTNGRAFPRERMGVRFSAWLVDLPFTGQRTWNMRVNWLYKAEQAMSLTDIQKAVNSFYAGGVNYADTTSG